MNRLDALQSALAGEHAAVYGYGVIGARLAVGPARSRAQAAYDTHRARRTSLRSLVAAAGAEPVAATAAYDLGGQAVTTAQVTALAGRIELACAATYGDLVGASDAADRGVPAGWLRDSAVRAAGWTGVGSTFPGLTERNR